MSGDERQIFSSRRERRLWVWALAVVVAIYATADLARTVADALRESGLLEYTATLFSGGMLLIGVMILVQGLRERSRGVEVGFALGVAAIAVIGFARGISPPPSVLISSSTRCWRSSSTKPLSNGKAREGASPCPPCWRS